MFEMSVALAPRDAAQELPHPTARERKQQRDRDRSQQKRDAAKADVAAYAEYCKNERDRKRAKQVQHGRSLQVRPARG